MLNIFHTEPAWQKSHWILPQERHSLLSNPVAQKGVKHCFENSPGKVPDHILVLGLAVSSQLRNMAVSRRYLRIQNQDTFANQISWTPLSDHLLHQAQGSSMSHRYELKINPRKFWIFSPGLEQANLHHVRYDLIWIKVSKETDLVDLLKCLLKPSGSQDDVGQLLQVGTDMFADGLEHI